MSGGARGGEPTKSRIPPRAACMRVPPSPPRTHRRPCKRGPVQGRRQATAARRWGRRRNWQRRAPTGNDGRAAGALRQPRRRSRHGRSWGRPPAGGTSGTGWINERGCWTPRAGVILAMVETPHGRWRASAARPTLSGRAAPVPTTADPASSEGQRLSVKLSPSAAQSVRDTWLVTSCDAVHAARTWSVDRCFPAMPAELKLNYTSGAEAPLASLGGSAPRPSMRGPTLQRGRHHLVDPHYFTCMCTPCVHASRSRHACAARSPTACRCAAAAAACRRAPPRAAARHPAAAWAVARQWPRGGNDATSCPTSPEDRPRQQTARRTPWDGH